MSLNDIDLTECTRSIHENTGRLDEIVREGKLQALITAAAKIEDAARKLGWRALELAKK